MVPVVPEEHLWPVVEVDPAVLMVVVQVQSLSRSQQSQRGPIPNQLLEASAKPVGQEVLVVPLVAVVVLAAQLTLKLVPGQEVLVVPEVAVVVLEAVRARLVAKVTGSAGFSVFVVSSVLAFLEGCVAPTPHVLMPGWAPQVVRYS